MQGILEQLSDFGQMAVVAAEFLFVATVWVALLWKPRHRTHRQPHDCRASGCPWLNDRPTR
ncbi:MAG: hypothetical protein E6J38_11880 [Chloroflexi bacterium]|nr:MAG: hypothetical protein E6J49_15710 [Chloroflexota bacterium]TMB78543.1 MAG: hypothetical protein E6J52_04505 [Chloroflexota bacterium]TMB92930.1 MAG: hypothetical protein E6J38_11880 [Chloroflexota bacterium]TMC26823.1 MAG: hypothetical protein E6J27_12335 [Chloroflexota bacterium]TMC35829.1 MAG: hypothetical protein E6J24_03330 [Chloroflexota bacterium]